MFYYNAVIAMQGNVRDLAMQGESVLDIAMQGDVRDIAMQRLCRVM